MADPPGNFFAAVPVEVPVAVLRAFREGAPDGLRWFHPDDLHVTLAFFGQENPDRVGVLQEVRVVGRSPGPTVPFHRPAGSEVSRPGRCSISHSRLYAAVPAVVNPIVGARLF